MAILFPNTPATHRSRSGFDLYGRPALGPPRQIRVGVVRLEIAAERTSVRADSSASRGASEESRVDAVVLVPPSVPVAIGDLITLEGVDLEVVSTYPRRDGDGRLSHHQVELRRSQIGAV